MSSSQFVVTSHSSSWFVLVVSSDLIEHLFSSFPFRVLLFPVVKIWEFPEGNLVKVTTWKSKKNRIVKSFHCTIIIFIKKKKILRHLNQSRYHSTCLYPGTLLHRKYVFKLITSQSTGNVLTLGKTKLHQRKAQGLKCGSVRRSAPTEITND